MIIFIDLSVKINYFILFIKIIITHNYLFNTPGYSAKMLQDLSKITKILKVIWKNNELKSNALD